MASRKFIIILLLAAFSLAGCGSAQDRQMLQQAKDALKQGKVQVSIKNTKTILGRSPNNFLAKRMAGKIKAYLLKEAEKDMQNKNYKEAVEKMESALDLDPKDENAKKLLTDAKKNLELANAKKALEENNPMVALRSVQEALRLDPEFQEAKSLEAEARQQVQVKIDNLVGTAQQLIEQGNFEKLRDLAQDILAIDPQNKNAADFLREALAQILTRNKAENLEMARKFYNEGIYESAKSKAEEVLKVDPQSSEAKDLVERSMAELSKPELRLTGLTKIRDMVFASIEVPATREKFKVKEGETFLNNGDFKVSAVDLELKAAVITYTKTGSQQTLTLVPRELITPPPAAPEPEPKEQPKKGKKRKAIVFP